MSRKANPTLIAPSSSCARAGRCHHACCWRRSWFGERRSTSCIRGRVRRACRSARRCYPRLKVGTVKQFQLGLDPAEPPLPGAGDDRTGAPCGAHARRRPIDCAIAPRAAAGRPRPARAAADAEPAHRPAYVESRLPPRQAAVFAHSIPSSANPDHPHGVQELRPTRKLPHGQVPRRRCGHQCLGKPASRRKRRRSCPAAHASCATSSPLRPLRRAGRDPS